VNECITLRTGAVPVVILAEQAHHVGLGLPAVEVGMGIDQFPGHGGLSSSGCLSSYRGPPPLGRW